jgi:ElaB/YqjD/DUF883 family membrane-anchored ribosome-binding protein
MSEPAGKQPGASGPTDEVDRALYDLRTLRDEARLQLHLAGLDAKDKLRDVENRLEALENEAKQATGSMRRTLMRKVADVAGAFRELLQKKSA